MAFGGSSCSVLGQRDDGASKGAKEVDQFSKSARAHHGGPREMKTHHSFPDVRDGVEGAHRLT